MAPVPKELKQARENGDSFYTTGKPCVNGHVGLRRVSDRGCVLCEKKARAKLYNKFKTTATKEQKQHKIYVGAKYRAKRENIIFTLEEDELVWNTFCPVFGEPLDYYAQKKPSHMSVSLDRFIPKKGYTKGNVETISYRANQLKSNADPGELALILIYMLRNRKEILSDKDVERVKILKDYLEELA